MTMTTPLTPEMHETAAESKLHLVPHQIILRPLVTEKGVHRSTRHNAYAFEVNKLANKHDVRRAVEELFNVKVIARAHAKPQGQAAPQPLPHRPHARIGRRRSSRSIPSIGSTSSKSELVGQRGVERGEALTDCRDRSLSHSDQPKSSLVMGIRRYNPTTPGRRGATVSDFADLTPGAKPARALTRPQEDDRRPQQPGRDHRPASRRRAQAAVSADRFPPQQGRRAGARSHSIQYDPNRSARIALLHYVDGEKRYILAPDGLDSRGSGDERAGCSAVGRQLPAAEEHSAGHDGSQYRIAAGSRRAFVPLGRFRRDAGGPRGRLGPDRRCPAAKFAACRPPAGRRSARSAMPTT